MFQIISKKHVGFLQLLFSHTRELECLRCWENMISQFLQMIKQHVHWVVEQEKISKCLLEAVQDNCSSILGENRYMTS